MSPDIPAPTSTPMAGSADLEAAIDGWVACQFEDANEGSSRVPDFWDELDTSRRLAEHLVAAGWARMECQAVQKMPALPKGSKRTAQVADLLAVAGVALMVIGISLLPWATVLAVKLQMIGSVPAAVGGLLGLYGVSRGGSRV